MKKKRLLKVVSLIIPLLCFSILSFGQSLLVKGTVKDNTGAPIPGATVVLKGTTQGTITDQDGVYSLKDVSSNGVLVFSFVGMTTKEVSIAGQTSINVTLSSEVSDLDEVVVIGYGVQRKEAVTGSVASMKGEVLRDVASSNITQALQGRIPGVQMDQTSTKPGAAMQIRIRGNRSLTASNDPLVVLDGIPFAGSIGDIDPNNIKSIDILKDASATAIYGSRGANGVILVTSLKGNTGQKAQFSYNSYYGMKQVFGKYPMMNGKEFVKLRQDAGMYTNSLDEADNIDTDWQDLFYRKANLTSHDIAVMGGTEQGNYTFGLGYYHDEAVVPTQQYNRISMRASIDQNIGEYFKIGISSNSNYNISEGNQIGIYGVLSMSPIANPYDSEGKIKRTIKMPLDEPWTITRDVINSLGDKWVDETKAFGSYNTAYGEVKIPGIEGLKYRANLGLNFRMTNG
ncbi:MAG TPA: SusC/RagA family TonB-linked outer membrane protein, partial [Prolixibacteraceae bacterium]|nr:SusC/RagA family TonB-linked outer membrane protein [Prolixibacteraceae bacterium]